MLDRKIIEDVMSGVTPSKFLKFVHTTDGTRVKYINTDHFKDFELKDGVLTLVDVDGRMILISGDDWASKRFNY